MSCPRKQRVTNTTASYSSYSVAQEGLSQAAHLGISSATYKVYEVKDLTEERKEHSEQ